MPQLDPTAANGRHSSQGATTGPDLTVRRARERAADYRTVSSARRSFARRDDPPDRQPLPIHPLPRCAGPKPAHGPQMYRRLADASIGKMHCAPDNSANKTLGQLPRGHPGRPAAARPACRRTRETPGRRTEHSRLTDTKSPGGRTVDLDVAVRKRPGFGHEVAEAVHTSTTSENRLHLHPQVLHDRVEETDRRRMLLEGDQEGGAGALVDLCGDACKTGHWRSPPSSGSAGLEHSRS